MTTASNAPATTQESVALDHAWHFIRQAPSLLVAAGAGMGVESGLPDFRGPNGLWRQYPGLAQAEMRFEDIANPSVFVTDPRLAWGFYGHRLQSYRTVVPHTGFAHLLRWGEAAPWGLAVYTSNVDGQFQKSGYTQHLIQECHGSLHHLQCAVACCEETWPAEGFEPEVDRATSRLLNALPVCPHCGGLARPNVLMFNDADWIGNRTLAQRQTLNRWVSTVEPGVVVEIGAGKAVATVRAYTANRQREGWKLVRINPDCNTGATPTQVELAITARTFFDAMMERQHTA
jgi:NAD-dependent SIR2 family protein deacetylase